MIAKFLQKERTVSLGMLKPGDTFSSSNSVFMIIDKDGLKEYLPDCIPYICLSSASPERTSVGKIYSMFENVCATPKVFKLVEISEIEALQINHINCKCTQTENTDEDEDEDDDIRCQKICEDKLDEDDENEPEKFDGGMI